MISTKMDFTYICCIILALISSTFAFRDSKGFLSFPNLYDTHRIDTRSARRYCGSEITRTLNFLCESYNKRSSYSRLTDRNGEDNDNLEADYGIEKPKYSLALVKLLNNPNELRYYRRQIRGVVDDCCKRSCTTNQLAQYCDVVRIATTTPAAD